MSVRIKHTDTYASLLFIGVAAAIYVVSGGFPEGSSQAPGAGFFPRLIAVCIGGLAVVQLLQSRFSEPGDAYELTRPVIKRVAAPLALLVAYVVTMPLLGFLLGTVVFLAVLLWYSEIRERRTIAIFALGIAISLQYVFGNILRVPLPDGVLPVAELLPDLALVIEVL